MRSAMFNDIEITSTVEIPNSSMLLHTLENGDIILEYIGTDQITNFYLVGKES